MVLFKKKKEEKKRVELMVVRCDEDGLEKKKKLKASFLKHSPSSTS